MKIRLINPDDDVHATLVEANLLGVLCEANGKSAVFAAAHLDELAMPEVYNVFADVVAQELGVTKEVALASLEGYFAPTKH